jgi:hypothetical protein
MMLLLLIQGKPEDLFTKLKPERTEQPEGKHSSEQVMTVDEGCNEVGLRFWVKYKEFG